MQFITILPILQEFYLIEVFKTLSRLRHMQLLIWRPAGAAHRRQLNFTVRLEILKPISGKLVGNQLVGNL